MQRAKLHTTLMWAAPFLFVALFLCAADIVIRSRLSDEDADRRLPDLDQEVPSELTIYEGTAYGAETYLLAFRVAVINIGSGPMALQGVRPDAGTPHMQVNQIIERGDGPVAIAQSVGWMDYAASEGHQRWELLDFDRYELRSAEALHAGEVVAAHAAGFCLEDRYRTTGRFAGEPATRPAETGTCGFGQVDARNTNMALSVGYGDYYAGFIDGQQLPISGLPSGRYVLIHRVNADRRLQELSYENNAASVLLDLRWEEGRPAIQVIATCPDTDRCDRLAPAPDATGHP